MFVEAPVTSETRSVITLPPDIAPRPDIDDLEPSDLSSFPKVLRRRLDRFFATQNISPKADQTMWIKIAAGLSVLAGS